MADKMGIVVDLKIILPPRLVLSDVDLCALVGNLMDNALEYCSKCKNGEIIVTLCQKQGYFLIKIENSITKSVFQDNPHLHTIKKDKTVHGLGIRIVKEIAVRYGGEVVFQEKQGKFLAQVLVPNAQNIANIQNI
jgi:sensor histidine kinase regulating citrate/malate metabolism